MIPFKSTLLFSGLGIIWGYAFNHPTEMTHKLLSYSRVTSGEDMMWSTAVAKKLLANVDQVQNILAYIGHFSVLGLPSCKKTWQNWNVPRAFGEQKTPRVFFYWVAKSVQISYLSIADLNLICCTLVLEYSLVLVCSICVKMLQQTLYSGPSRTLRIHKWSIPRRTSTPSVLYIQVEALCRSTTKRLTTPGKLKTKTWLDYARLL